MKDAVHFFDKLYMAVKVFIQDRRNGQKKLPVFFSDGFRFLSVYGGKLVLEN